MVPPPWAFDISHQPAVAQLWRADITQSGIESQYCATAAISLDTISVQPGATGTFSIDFTPPAAPDFTIYSGSIMLTPADTASTQVEFLRGAIGDDRKGAINMMEWDIVLFEADMSRRGAYWCQSETAVLSHLWLCHIRGVLSVTCDACAGVPGAVHGHGGRLTRARPRDA